MSEHVPEDRLHDLVDQELSDAARVEVEEHLATCATCREEVDALRRLLDSAAALPEEIAPGRDLWPELADRLPMPGNRDSRSTSRSNVEHVAGVCSLAIRLLYRAGAAVSARCRSPAGWSVGGHVL